MFKNIRNYIKYRRIVDKNRSALKEKFKIKVDDVYRLYTTVGLDEEQQYLFTRYDYSTYQIEEKLDTEVRQYINTLSRYLMDTGLIEFITVNSDSLVRVDQINVDLIIDFKMINIIKVVANMRKMMFGDIILFLLGTGIYFLFPFLWFAMLIPLGIFAILMLTNYIIFKKLFI